LVGDVEEVGLLHHRSRSATRRMLASRRRPDTWRAAPRSPSPPTTKPTARAGDSGLPVLARLVAPAGDLVKLSPRTCVGTLVLVTAPPTSVVVVAPAAVVVVDLTVVVVAPATVVVVAPGVVVGVDPGGQSFRIQITLCFSPPGRCTVTRMWNPCCGCGAIPATKPRRSRRPVALSPSGTCTISRR